MDPLDRLISDVSQLTKRLDDYSMRLVLVEVHVKNFDEKLDDIKASIERWNRLGYWLVTLVGGSLMLAILKFIYDGGLVATARAVGL